MHRDLAALIAFLDTRAATAFGWGRKANDCVAFQSATEKAMTGRHRLGELSWTTPRGALRVIRRLGGLEAAYDARYDRIAPARARRGDIAGVPDALLGIRIMVVEGDTLAGPGEHGIKREPRSNMTIAWSIDPKGVRA